MTRVSMRGWAAATASVAVLAAIAGAAAKRSDPSVAWLDGVGPSAWIVYPSPADTKPRQVVELDASFRRTFHVDAAPASATLRVRAFRTGVVRVNGREAAVTAGPDWKAETRVEIAGLLRAGENEIDARVSNAAGPPALWLALELPGGALVSDERWTSSWAGAAARPAARATDPKPGRMHDPDGRVPSSFAAVAAEWPRLALFALLAAALVAGAILLERARPGWPVWSAASPWPLRAAAAAVGALWLLQVANNAPWLPASMGFDAPAHLEYAAFIQERRAIPFADDGWQMFQPPLYYLLVAGITSAAGLSAVEPGAIVLVRGLGLATGLAHLALLAACMRALFPGQPRRQIAGVVVGGLLPCMLYLHQYPANEPLLAMISTGAILAALRALRRDEPGLAGHAALGVLLGLALLAKATALLLVPPILGALAARALFGDARWRPRRLLGAALAGGTLVATCGWYYASVWRRFGTPFVGGWDASRGMGWWQDPGYRTLDDFLRFGRAFTAPLFAGFDGVWDGLYVTLWGDGLLSGRISTALVPPWWSPTLMSAALLLAVVPATAVVAGGAAAVVRWLRDPDAATGLLVSLALLAALSVGSMAVAVPAIAADKASYGLLALVPFCAFAARALGAAASGGRWIGPVLASALGVWGLASYSTWWIDASSGKARLLRGADDAQRGDRAQGLALIREAQARDADDWPSRVVLAGYLLQAGGARSEIERLLAPGADVPGNPLRHLALAGLAFQEGDAARVDAALRRAIAADPDNLRARMQLAALAERRGDLEGAVGELREALRIDPQHHAAHVALATLSAAVGEPERAELHRAWAARLSPAQ